MAVEAAVLKWVHEVVMHGLQQPDRQERVIPLLPDSFGCDEALKLDDLCDAKLLCGIAISCDPSLAGPPGLTVPARITFFQKFCEKLGVPASKIITAAHIWPKPISNPGLLLACLGEIGQLLSQQPGKLPQMPAEIAGQAAGTAATTEEEAKRAAESAKQAEFDKAVAAMAPSKTKETAAEELRRLKGESDSAEAPTPVPAPVAAAAARAPAPAPTPAKPQPVNIAEADPSPVVTEPEPQAKEEKEPVPSTSFIVKATDDEEVVELAVVPTRDEEDDEGVLGPPASQEPAEEPAEEPTAYSPPEGPPASSFKADAMPTMEGYLFKRSGDGFLLRHWDRRFFVLRNMHIQWWKQKEDASDETDGGPLCKGTISLLSDPTEIELDGKSSTKFYLRPKSGKWGGGTTSGRDSGRVFTFDAKGSEHERAEWTRVIQLHIEKALHLKAPELESFRSGATVDMAGPPSAPAVAEG